MNTNKLNKLRLSFFLLLILVVSGCAEKKQAPATIQEIPVVKVLQRDIPIHKEFVGQVFGEKDIPIRARVEGFLEGIHFDEGFKVKKGQLLYSIDPKPLEAKVNAQKSRVAEAETVQAKTKSDLDRYKPLAEKNAVSQSDLDAKQAQYDAALSSLEAAKSNLKSAEIELGYTRIYSPLDGIIGKTKAKVGDFVGRDPNPVILNTVSKTDRVKVTFYITEAEYLDWFREFISPENESKRKARNQENENEEGKLELILSDGTTYEHKGKIDFIDRGVDASTGSILLQADFPNPDFILRPGLYAKVKIELEIKEGALLVPQRCLMELQGQFSVYAVNNNVVESRQVTVGEKIGDYVLITDGLSANDQVVIDALQKVRSGMEILPTPIEFESQNTQL
jgi:membrane fusion protein (multidrug efflux system)